MGISICSKLCLLIIRAYVLLSFSFSFAVSVSSNRAFMHCLRRHLPPQLIYTRHNHSFAGLLNSSIKNDRFSSRPRPLLILTPTDTSQVQASIMCSKQFGFQIRVLSGGHDYEGLSFLSQEPFVVVHLLNLRSITVNMEDHTAWVQSGATLGELYYGIAQKSGTHGFPAGLCPTVGVGGHFAGGGMGTLMRKYGLAADSVMDAQLVDAHGRILDRSSMGEDLFWAIRGGGAASFGVVLSWKIKLVPVPPIVTIFNLVRTLEQNVTKLVHKWQHIGHKLHEDLFIRLLLQNFHRERGRKVGASFNSLFLGRAEKRLLVMESRFPELGLTAKDCKEMTWIESTLYFGGFSDGAPTEALLTKDPPYGRTPLKGKSDFVQKPIPEHGLEGIWKRISKEDQVYIILDPLGGKMNNVSMAETPFPHRKGNLYNIQYMVKWEDNKEAKKHMDWMGELYRYMEPYVSESPRRAYFNYKDLELGMNEHGCNTSFFGAREWGLKYFASNFERLGRVKAVVDEENFFRNEQSIPPLLAKPYVCKSSSQP